MLPKSFASTEIPRNICIKFRKDIQVPYKDPDEVYDYILKKEILPMKKLKAQYKGIEIGKYFTSVPPERIMELINEAMEDQYEGRSMRKRNRPARVINDPPRLLSYFRIKCPYGTDIFSLQKLLHQYPSVELAYVEGGPCPPPVNAGNDRRSVKQNYLDPARTGIDARFAWTVPGGDGSSSVEFADIENGWTLNHQDLPRNIDLLYGTNCSNRGHGTSVLGIVLAKDNTKGGIGITPSVHGNVISQFRTAQDFSTADAILHANSVMSFGDVVLLESQTQLDNGLTFLPCEVEGAVLEAMQNASSKLVIIEAAGNGTQNGGRDLDHWTDPNTGKSPLNRKSRHDFNDSGAIMVAAATSEDPHEKITNSNFGSRIDCFAWGENITTSGDGGDGDLSTAYTDTFDGTSGASAIIAGAAVALQSMSETHNGLRFHPASVREILGNHSYGTMPGSATHAIGVMPDLRRIYNGEFVQPA